MIKINKKQFLYEILKEEPESSDKPVPEISSNEVREFKLGNNYFYELFDISPAKPIQRSLIDNFLSKIELNNACTAFRENLSYLNFLEPHKNGYHFLRLDIKSFFHSINKSDLEKAFEPYFENEAIDSESEQTLLDAFLNIVTYKVPETSPNSKLQGKHILPIGFSSSPVISNIVFRPIDILIQKFCLFRNITYTRYADDLLFSSTKDEKFVLSESFEKEICIYINTLNLNLNKNKTIRRNHTISLNGYTIQSSLNPLPNGISLGTLDSIFNPPPTKNNEIRISNKKTKTIRKLIHMILVRKLSSPVIMKKVYGFKVKNKYIAKPLPQKSFEKFADNQLFNKLTGYRSYLISIVKFNSQHHCINSNSIEKYTRIISDINTILDKWKGNL
jgi:RNA-directed DNA polymerase